MFLRKALLAVSTLLWLMQAALAQSYPPWGAPYWTAPIPATVGGTAALAVTNASGTVSIPAANAAFPSINITNSGSVALYYALGSSATINSAYLGPGLSACIAAGNATTLAAITASSSTTLQITQTNVCLVGLNSGSGG